jgi:hypothetical protein
MKAMQMLRQAIRSASQSTGVFLRDVGYGLLEVSHNTLALLGLAVAAALVFIGGRADLRQHLEQVAFDWLHERHEERTLRAGDLLAVVGEPTAVERATAADPRELTREQSAVARWLAKRYKVAPEPVSRLVQEAWSVGRRAGLDPTLILAVMAIESSFNPFAQSPMGAQGLMQVMTRVHDDKYEAFGGTHAAFDPISNLRVGVQVLKDCISRAGSLNEGLKYYVGAALAESDGGYVGRVLAEQLHLRNVADGKPVPVNAQLVAPAAAGRAADAAKPVPERASDAEKVALLR